MSGPYDLNGKRSVAECLPIYTSRDSQARRGLYEPIGLVMKLPSETATQTQPSFEEQELEAWRRSEKNRVQPSQI